MDTTQSALEELGRIDDMSEEGSDIDLVENSGKRRKIFRKTRSCSLSQPLPASSLHVQIDDEDDNKIMIKMLKSISKQFTTLKKSFTTEIGAIKEDLKIIKDDVAEIKRERELSNPDAINHSVSMEILFNQVNNIEDKITKIGSSIDEKAISTIPDKSSSKGLKDKITTVTDLDDKIDKRKKAFYNQHQLRDRIQIHQDWLNQEPPIIPASFVPKYIPKEPEREYEIRKRQKMNELHSKIEIWEVRAKEAEDTVKHYDDIITQAINSSEKNDEEKENEKKAWLDLMKFEEEKSQNIWKKKRVDILAQPTRQKENKKIQTLEGKLYSTVVKNGTEETEYQNNNRDSSWQTVTYRNNRRNYQHRNQTNGQQSGNFYGRKPPNRYKRY